MHMMTQATACWSRDIGLLGSRGLLLRSNAKSIERLIALRVYHRSKTANYFGRTSRRTLHTLTSEDIWQSMQWMSIRSHFKSNQIYFAINSVHNITMSLHCIWLDRQAITSRLCLPMTTKPKKIKNNIKTK